MIFYSLLLILSILYSFYNYINSVNEFIYYKMSIKLTKLKAENKKSYDI